MIIINIQNKNKLRTKRPKIWTKIKDKIKAWSKSLVLIKKKSVAHSSISPHRDLCSPPPPHMYRLKLTCEQNRQRSGCFFGKCFITEFPGIRESRRQITRDSKYPENCHFPGNFPSREFPWESLLMTLRKIGQWHWNSGYRQRKSITLISVPRPSETM